ncbi:MAG: Wzz/FepE/Etk N-terminal domain-containing protein [Candidatus Omnitrophota bacterium]
MYFYEMSLSDNLRLILKRIRVLFYVLTFSMVFVFLALSLVTPKYKSEIMLLVSGLPQIESPFYQSIPAMRTVDIATTFSEIIDNEDFVMRVVRLLELDERADKSRFQSPVKRWLSAKKDAVSGFIKKMMESFGATREKQDKTLKTVEAVARNIKIESIERTDVIKVTVYDYNPEIAGKIADKLVKVFMLFNMRQQSLEYESKYGGKYPKMIQIQEELIEARNDLNSEKTGFSEIWNRGNIKVIGQAFVSTKPVNINKKLSFSIAFILAVMLGLALIYFLEMVDPGFRSPADVGQTLGLPVLACLPVSGKKNMARGMTRGGSGAYSDAYEFFLAGLYLGVEEKKFSTLAVVSAEAGEGRTTIAKNMALLFSNKGGFKTLLIDSDFISSSLHKAFKVPMSPGLIDLLDGDVPVADAVRKIDADLDFMPLGNKGNYRSGFLGAGGIIELAKELKEKYDVIIFDAPPMKNCADALLLSRQAEMNILVIMEGGSRRDTVKNTVERAKDMGIGFSGVILNRHF